MNFLKVFNITTTNNNSTNAKNNNNVDINDDYHGFKFLVDYSSLSRSVSASIPSAVTNENMVLFC